MSRTYDYSAGASPVFRTPDSVKVVQRQGESWVQYRTSEIAAYWDVARPSTERSFGKKTIDDLLAALFDIGRRKLEKKPLNTSITELVQTFGPLGIGHMPGPRHPNGATLANYTYGPVDRDEQGYLYAPVQDFVVFAMQLRSIEVLAEAIRLKRCDETAKGALRFLNPGLAQVAKDLDSIDVLMSVFGNVFHNWVAQASDVFGWSLDVSIVPGKRPQVRQSAYSMPALAIWGTIARQRVGRNPAAVRVCKREGCNNEVVAPSRTVCDECKKPGQARQAEYRERELAENPIAFRAKEAARRKESRRRLATTRTA